MKKWHQLWTCTAADQLSALSAIYLRRLAQARAELQPGGRLLVPLGPGARSEHVGGVRERCGEAREKGGVLGCTGVEENAHGRFVSICYMA